MNVPDVVQALRMMTELSAVSWSWIQFWFGGKPEQREEGIEAERGADAVEQAVRARRGRSTGS